jgi:hypothetical protein
MRIGFVQIDEEDTVHIIPYIKAGRLADLVDGIRPAAGTQANLDMPEGKGGVHAKIR